VKTAKNTNVLTCSFIVFGMLASAAMAQEVVLSIPLSTGLARSVEIKRAELK
jgi:hypothetical protein